MKTPYSTDLSDAEWTLLEPYLPTSKSTGRPRMHCPHEMLNAIFFYVLRSGCPWRLLPRNFPPWKTVYHYYFRAWRIEGTFERLNALSYASACGGFDLVERPSSERGHRVDSQSAKTSGVGGEARGYDGGKKVRGRKRHLLVDTEGLVLKVKIHSAKVPDQDGIKLLLKAARDRLGRLSHLWVDAGYEGRGEQ
jgi:putative transposase